MRLPSFCKDTGTNARPNWLVLLAVIAVLPWFSGPFVLHLAVLTCLNILIVSGLAVISRSGQLSFGHAAFVAIGAYVSVLFTSAFGGNIVLTALAGILLAVVFAYFLGWVILRLKGVYFVLVTFSFGELIRLVLLDWGEITGGANGIANIAPIKLMGYAFDSRARFYMLALVAALLAVLAMRSLFKSPLGQAIDAVADNPALAESTGVSVHRVQLVAFVMGCALAACGGVLQARYIGFISPESFNPGLSVAFIIMLVIGGRKSVWGPVVGAIVLTPLPELFRGAVQTQHIFYGAALILILRFMPDGLISLMAQLRRKSKRGHRD
jgi:branched-chain amino acid transport system permease protein